MNNLAFQPPVDTLATTANHTLRSSTVGILRRLWPYLVVLLIVPGGTLIAPLLWLYRQRPSRNAPDRGDKQEST